MEVCTAEMAGTKSFIGAAIVECTAMLPYCHNIRASLGMPVFDVVDAVHFIMEGIT